MVIIIIGINYAPEPIGIGPYTTGLAEALARAGHKVSMITAKPYYPNWKVEPLFKGGGGRQSTENGVNVYRCPIYVPRKPSGFKRILHHLSFCLRALLPALRSGCLDKPDVVLAIAPSLISSLVAKCVARLFGARTWLHVQDFEVDAAFATGLLSKKGIVAYLATAFEQRMYRFDRISTISPQMKLRLLKKGVPETRSLEVRNWADIDKVKPLVGPSIYREKWSINRQFVALYSGNIANKQGINVIIEVAKLLEPREDLMFIVCGNGPNKNDAEAAASGMSNVRFFDLQPIDALSQLLGLATVHLLPQIAGAADLVLPSKLTNMLASGRAVVVTAAANTGLAYEVDGCGLCVAPGDIAQFAAAINYLLDHPNERELYGRNARDRAVKRWSKNAILEKFTMEFESMGTGEGDGEMNYQL